MTRPKTHSDHALTVLPTAREPGHCAHPLGAATIHAANQTAKRCRVGRGPYPTRPSAARQPSRRPSSRVTRPWSPSNTKTDSSADQVGAEFAVQQVHQG